MDFMYVFDLTKQPARQSFCSVLAYLFCHFIFLNKNQSAAGNVIQPIKNNKPKVFHKGLWIENLCIIVSSKVLNNM